MEIYVRERRKQKTVPTDRLSDLPDEILCHILSFLPTQTSIATSILSRRWRFLWAYVPNLFFDRDDNQHIIDRVLVLHKLPTLKSFIMDFGYQRFDEFQVETWIIAAIERNIQFLELDVDYHTFLPSRLFTCETLVDLRLYYCGTIRRLDRVRLPRLKTLYLKYIHFEDDESLPCLLSGSPVLQYLRIISDMELDLRSCYISSSTLKWLCLEYLVGIFKHKLEINTPALEYLSVRDNLSGPIGSGDLNSLIAANIYHRHYGDMEEGEVLLKFVDSLSNVKHLKLDLSEYATIVDSVFSTWTPSFNNLTELELTAEPCFLSIFLENANNLEILKFCRPTHRTKGWKEPKQVPKCLLSRLRTIKVDNILDSLKIIRYLLRNAKVLKWMDIVYPRHIDVEEMNDLLQEISLFKRGSEECKVAFVKS